MWSDDSLNLKHDPLFFKRHQFLHILQDHAARITSLEKQMKADIEKRMMEIVEMQKEMEGKVAKPRLW